MIKHTVMWTINEDIKDKDEVFNKIKEGLEGLKDKVDVIIDINVCKNINPNEKYDIILFSTFNSLEDIEIYANNDDHNVVAAYIKTVVCARSAVDSEI